MNFTTSNVLSVLGHIEPKMSKKYWPCLGSGSVGAKIVRPFINFILKQTEGAFDKKKFF